MQILPRIMKLNPSPPRGTMKKYMAKGKNTFVLAFILMSFSASLTLSFVDVVVVFALSKVNKMKMRYMCAVLSMVLAAEKGNSPAHLFTASRVYSNRPNTIQHSIGHDKMGMAATRTRKIHQMKIE